MPKGMGYPNMKDHNADKHSEMKDGAKLYKPGENQDAPKKGNMSASKPVLGAPGSEVVMGKKQY